MTCLEGTSWIRQDAPAFIVAGLGADVPMMQEQAAMKRMNEEQSDSLKTACCTGPVARCVGPDQNLCSTT